MSTSSQSAAATQAASGLSIAKMSAAQTISSLCSRCVSLAGARTGPCLATHSMWIFCDMLYAPAVDESVGSAQYLGRVLTWERCAHTILYGRAICKELMLSPHYTCRG